MGDAPALLGRPTPLVERLTDRATPRVRRSLRIAALVAPVAVTAYSVWYDALAADEAPDPLQLLVFVAGGASLWLSRRALAAPTLVAPLVWAITGSCSFVVVTSALVAARRPVGWWVVLGTYTALHPLGLVPDPCMFRAGHVVAPEETAPLFGVVLPALVGGAVGESRRLVRIREDRLRLAAEAAAARAADAVAHERLRISRDMHDVVGQGVSRMTLHAAALATTAPDPATRRSAERIAATGADLLEDVHFVVGLLRDGAAPAPVRPTGWEETFRRAADDGLDVRRHGPARGPLARTAGLDDDRAAVLDAVLAEALHNAHKHAPDAPVDVRAAVLPDRVRLTVENPCQGAGRPPGPGGHGLAVATERAVEVGGTLGQHRTEGGRFRLELELPR